MSDTLLFPSNQPTSDSMDSTIVHVENKPSEEYVGGTASSHLTEPQKIEVLQSGNDWYQKDLSHMTTNLMNAEMNATALTQTVAIAPTNLILDGVNKAIPTIDYGGWTIGWKFMSASKYGPGDYHGTDNFVKIETDVAHERANYIFNNVYGRAPNTEELDNATKIIFHDSSKYSYLQKQLAYTQEGHDRVLLAGFDVLGYTPSEEWIQQEQAKLATYNVGEYPLYKDQYIGTLQKVREDFAYSQAGYDSIKENASRILGYNWDNADNIRNLQNNLANGDSMQNIINTFAYGEETYNSIRSMYSAIFGYDWNDGDIIRNEQTKLANGASVVELRYNAAHSEDYRNALVKMLSDVSGEDMSTAEYAGWISSLQDAAGSWATMAELRNNFINSLEA